ncbi:hypothetical protein MAPG_04586 [Magnaporthiopsis poae ATCC 64411]|uniref:Helix-turn-helix-domain containing protein type n=1 Tax=Magnaporthiopsis poae (strain ATCC 64411 / 73-15) TaxID=644358 RepID=A0A0C4DX48_MAGP6|nr:hypothetical protein MAPG_04586 [Magnaporthiopsis poae ATCC 64411]
MPGITLYESSGAVFEKGLKALDAILSKAEAHAAEQGINADTYPAEKLIEGMLPLSFQVQVVSNTTKKWIQRITGAELNEWEDNETTMAQLHARVKKTLDLLATVDAAAVNGKEDNIVELQMGKLGTRNMPAKEYTLNYAVPNFFFHLQTAYAILRAKGVPLGKPDYLGPFLG